ncbi:uncharacterized protein K489DRAFT_321608 [Dissoconium aciculare CBS 342.82]|uniref:EamA domain-containing protein n=1 Tax=Dissoconium aciculare CBS 342.82 TaxID=1314786 RepID=A0A6J3M397_9PEZI|nr:uncharacterized protein K489DRAFT_321608 [Dissoconium aciculare CBS 342.82]KAF1821402.1 hypothetical protein K489DRAFT_321608 [Dissoconium aciculare CBS 342.82]
MSTKPSSASSPAKPSPSPSLLPQWILPAALSGLCAAANGVFAKLVTTQLTTSWAGILTEVVLNLFFLLLNISFNGVMWALFTKALTLATSSVQVSVINTSANFMATAILGMVVFGEELPALWWVGAAMLIAGSVIIGRRDGDDVAAKKEKKSDQQAKDDADKSAVSSGSKASHPAIFVEAATANGGLTMLQARAGNPDLRKRVN